MPIFGREEDRGEGARASSAWQGDRMEPTPALLFPGAPSPLGPQAQAAHTTHRHSSQRLSQPTASPATAQAKPSTAMWLLCWLI